MTRFNLRLLLVMVLLAVAAAAADLPADALIQPDALAIRLRSGNKPLLFHVGPRKLYEQAHIPGSEFMGAAADPENLRNLKHRVAKLPKSAEIVLYCGCCPWQHCPNVQPAYEALRALGFSNVKVLYIAQNFGADWVVKGYPVAKGD